jgi:hypothetical protein
MDDTSNPSTTALAVRDQRTARLARFEPTDWDSLWSRAKLAAAALRLTPEAAAIKMLYGVDLGIPMTQALTSVHVFESKGSVKVVIDAATLRSVVLSHQRPGGVVETFGPVELSNGRCVWRAKRAGQPPVDVTWTWEDAVKAGLHTKANWQAHPRQMLAARASAEAARLVFADVIAGFYSTEEIDEAPVKAPAPAVESVPATIESASQRVLAAARSRLPAQAPVSAPTETPPSVPEPEAKVAHAAVQAPQAPEEDVRDVTWVDPETGEVHDVQIEPEPPPPTPAPPQDHVQAGADRMRRAIAEAAADLGPDRAAWVARRWTEGPRRLRKGDSQALVKAKIDELSDALMRAVDEASKGGAS